MKKVFALVLVSLFALVVGCGGAQPTMDTTTVEESATVVPDASAADPIAGLDATESADDASIDDAAPTEEVAAEVDEAEVDAVDASDADAAEGEM